jgi:hypothetical protein
MATRGGITFSYLNGEEIEDPDIVYLDLQIINNGSQPDGTKQDGPDPLIVFSQTRDQPIITDCSKYNFSIIRFSLNGTGKSLPIFIPSIRTGALNPGNNVNLTAYDAGLSVTVTYTVGPTTATETFSASAPVIYEPENLDTSVAPVPDPSTCQTGQNLSTRYYWVMTVSHWTKLVNKAYLSAYNDINTQFNAWYLATFALPGPNLITKVPVITFNSAQNLFSIYGDEYGFGDNQIPTATPNRTSAGGPADEDFSLFMDANLFGMYSNFDSQYVNLLNNLTYKVLVYDVGLKLNVAPTSSGTNYYVMTQDAPSTSTLWSPVDSIVFTSGTIPLVYEQVSEPTRFGEGNVNQVIGTQSRFAPIITDIQLYNESAFDYREYIQYSPQAEYRLSSFQRSKVPLNDITIQAFYKNRLDGNLYPLSMYNLSSASIKIMFRRRGIADYPHPVRQQPGVF